MNEDEFWKDAEIERVEICAACGVSMLPPEIPGEEPECENPECHAFGN